MLSFVNGKAKKRPVGAVKVTLLLNGGFRTGNNDLNANHVACFLKNKPSLNTKSRNILSCFIYR